MSFISFRYNYDHTLREYTWILKDNEFGVVEVIAATVWTAMVKAYSERNLPVGRNIALATIWYHNGTKDPIVRIVRSIKFQDEHCPSHIDDWQKYATERDAALEKLLPLL